MKMSQWRPALKSFLARYISISGYGVAEPDTYGVFMAHLPPLAEVLYRKSPPDIATGEAIQHVYILARYPGTMQYNDLPLATLEGLYCTLILHCELENSKLVATTAPAVPLLQSLATMRVDFPLKVEELSYANKDWLVVLHLALKLTWNAEPEVPLDVILLNGIDLEVWRSTLKAIPDATLDWKITLE